MNPLSLVWMEAIVMIGAAGRERGMPPSVAKAMFW